MRVALDTNILAYAEGVNGASGKTAALQLIRALPVNSAVIPVQALGELFTVLTRKAGRKPLRARAAILEWCDAFPVVATSLDVMLPAVDLATSHKISLWDAVMLSATAASGCRLLLSEDLQDGFTWNGVTVVNPFLTKRNALLDALLQHEPN